MYGATQDISVIKEREDEMETLVRELTYQRDSLEEFGNLVSSPTSEPPSPILRRLARTSCEETE